MSADDYHYHHYAQGDRDEHYPPHSAPVSSGIPTDTPAVAAVQKTIPDDPAQAAMYKLLGARLKCTLSDGRTATGTFVCLDRLKNMILIDVIEERVINRADYSVDATPKDFTVQRELAQAMIPGKHLVKVEAEKEDYDKRLK